MSELQTLESAVPTQIGSSFPTDAAEFLAYNAGWIDKLGGSVNPTGPGAAVDFSWNEPYGVVGAIVPWKAALMSLGQVLGPVLAAGNTIVLKPSELAPFTSLRLGESALESGLPPGVVNVVPGGVSLTSFDRKRKRFELRTAVGTDLRPRTSARRMVNERFELESDQTVNAVTLVAIRCNSGRSRLERSEPRRSFEGRSNQSRIA